MNVVMQSTRIEVGHLCFCRSAPGRVPGGQVIALPLPSATPPLNGSRVQDTEPQVAGTTACFTNKINATATFTQED